MEATIVRRQQEAEAHLCGGGRAGAERGGGLSDRDHFGMGCRILQLLSLVVAGGDHAAGSHHDRAHRNLILFRGQACFFESEPHPPVMLAAGKELVGWGADVEHSATFSGQAEGDGGFRDRPKNHPMMR